ncbi:MAG: hypothetical protein J5819_01535 [Eubacterium sp.]|nr:hypothetical protein [Eubacterium sp.]
MELQLSENTSLSEYDKTVSMLESMSDDELQALRIVATVISHNGLSDRPYRKLTKDEFLSRVDEGLKDMQVGDFVKSEIFESELAERLGLT